MKKEKNKIVLTLIFLILFITLSCINLTSAETLSFFPFNFSFSSIAENLWVNAVLLFLVVFNFVFLGLKNVLKNAPGPVFIISLIIALTGSFGVVYYYGAFLTRFGWGFFAIFSVVIAVLLVRFFRKKRGVFLLVVFLLLSLIWLFFLRSKLCPDMLTENICAIITALAVIIIIIGLFRLLFRKKTEGGTEPKSDRSRRTGLDSSGDGSVGRLQGHVKDKHSGDSISGANVVIHNEHGETSVITESSGIYHKDMPAGHYFADCHASGYTPERKKVEIKKHHPTICNFELKKGETKEEESEGGSGDLGALGVRVLHEGKPVKGAIVLINGRKIHPTNNRGLSGAKLKPGKYKVSVQAEEFKKQTKVVEVERGKIKVVTFNLKKGAGDDEEPEEESDKKKKEHKRGEPEIEIFAMPEHIPDSDGGSTRVWYEVRNAVGKRVLFIDSKNENRHIEDIKKDGEHPGRSIEIKETTTFFAKVIGDRPSDVLAEDEIQVVVGGAEPPKKERKKVEEDKKHTPNKDDEGVEDKDKFELRVFHRYHGGKGKTFPYPDFSVTSQLRNKKIIITAMPDEDSRIRHWVIVEDKKNERVVNKRKNEFSFILNKSPWKKARILEVSCVFENNSSAEKEQKDKEHGKNTIRVNLIIHGIGEIRKDMPGDVMLLERVLAGQNKSFKNKSSSNPAHFSFFHGVDKELRLFASNKKGTFKRWKYISSDGRISSGLPGVIIFEKDDLSRYDRSNPLVIHAYFHGHSDDEKEDEEEKDKPTKPIIVDLVVEGEGEVFLKGADGSKLLRKGSRELYLTRGIHEFSVEDSDFDNFLGWQFIHLNQSPRKLKKFKIDFRKPLWNDKERIKIKAIFKEGKEHGTETEEHKKKEKEEEIKLNQSDLRTIVHEEVQRQLKTLNSNIEEIQIVSVPLENKFRISGKIKYGKGLTAIPIKINGEIVNGGTLGIHPQNINIRAGLATGKVKQKLVPYIDKLPQEIRSFVERRYGKKVKKMYIQDSHLVIEFSGEGSHGTAQIGRSSGSSTRILSHQLDKKEDEEEKIKFNLVVNGNGKVYWQGNIFKEGVRKLILEKNQIQNTSCVIPEEDRENFMGWKSNGKEIPNTLLSNKYTLWIDLKNSFFKDRIEIAIEAIFREKEDEKNSELISIRTIVEGDGAVSFHENYLTTHPIFPSGTNIIFKIKRGGNQVRFNGLNPEQNKGKIAEWDMSIHFKEQNTTRILKPIRREHLLFKPNAPVFKTVDLIIIKAIFKEKREDVSEKINRARTKRDEVRERLRTLRKRIRNK